MTSRQPQLRRRAAASRVARLATVRPEGRPHVVPITFHLDADSLVTAVDEKPKSTTALQRLQNIRANPSVSILIDDYEEDWSRLWWIRLDGIARVVGDGEAREEAIAGLVEKYPQYEDDPPLGPVIRVTVSDWTSWSP